MEYLFGFRGRINRRGLWLFLPLAVAWALVVGSVVIHGFDWRPFLFSLEAQMHLGMQVDWQRVMWPSLQTGQAKMALAALGILFFLYFWARLATLVKRLHDRGKSGWWLLLFWAVPLVLFWGPQLTVLGVAVPAAVSAAAVYAAAAALAIDVWMFVELYCRRGTAGTNRYGPALR